MADELDIESLVHLEQSFFDEGFAEGHAHGHGHGLAEGLALGQGKGFEMWEELGFYEGFALVWKSVLTKQARNDDRVMRHVSQLLELISQFPTLNPSTAQPPPPTIPLEEDGGVDLGMIQETSTPEVDIPKLFRQIRSRYKVLCSTLGVKPSLRASDGSFQPPNVTSSDVDMDVDATTGGTPKGKGKSGSVWNVSPPNAQDLSF